VGKLLGRQHRLTRHKHLLGEVRCTAVFHRFSGVACPCCPTHLWCLPAPRRASLPLLRSPPYRKAGHLCLVQVLLRQSTRITLVALPLLQLISDSILTRTYSLSTRNVCQ
jgi:hypothetical protein